MSLLWSCAEISAEKCNKAVCNVNEISKEMESPMGGMKVIFMVVVVR